MKTLLTIFTLVFTVMFSSTSFAGWTKVVLDGSGNTHYVDLERIRKVDGFVYYWTLIDLSKPYEGVLSIKKYTQGDCKLFRVRFLSDSFHKKPMGLGTAQVIKPKGENANWFYAPPNSSSESNLKQVCSR